MHILEYVYIYIYMHIFFAHMIMFIYPCACVTVLITTDQEHMEIPEQHYKVVARIPSGEFQKICRDLKEFGETIQITGSTSMTRYDESLLTLFLFLNFEEMIRIVWIQVYNLYRSVLCLHSCPYWVNTVLIDFLHVHFATSH